ncbi:unnamed protein product [Sphagnum balticum]
MGEDVQNAGYVKDMTTMGENVQDAGCVKDMTTMGEDVQDAGSNGNSDMDMEMIRWLDSVHQLLCLRDSLSQVLRQGWMEMAQARYAMGPARISQPLYSLKPYAASASVSVKSSPSSGAPETAVDQEDVFQPTSNCAVHFALQKQSSDGDDHTSNQPSKNTLKSRNMHHSSKSGEQAQLVPSDWSREEDIAYKKLMGDTDDSDTDTELQPKTSTQALGSTKPLQWFGGLVSPHLRAAQSSFESALEIVVDIANAQSDAVRGHGHGDVKIQENVEGPQTPEQLMEH